MLKQKQWCIIPCLIFSMSLPAFARPSGPPPGHSGKKHEHVSEEQMHERVKKMRSRILRERVGLNEERATRIEAIFERFDDEHRTYQTLIHESRHTLHELLRSNSEDQSAYETAVADLRRGHKFLHETRARQFDAISQHLNPKEQAALLVSLGRMKHKMREKMHRKRGPNERGQHKMKPPQAPIN